MSTIGNINNANSKKSTSIREIDPVDKYSILIIRGAIIGTGLLGLALFVRNARMFAIYNQVKEISEDYYRLGIQMKGIIREVTPNGIIRVEHKPDMKLPQILTFRKKSKIMSRINLRLAGLDISPVGVEHMTKNLKIVGRPVVFKVIKPVEKQPDVTDSDVTAKKIMRSINLNVELVRKGYAKVYGLDNFEHKNALQSNTNYSRLITRLLTCEQIAEIRGLGLWERSSWVEKLASFPSTISQIIKQSAITKLLILSFYLIRDIALMLYSTGKNIYYTGLAIGGYTIEGYQRFSRLIDKLSGWYFGMKSRNQISSEQKQINK